MGVRLYADASYSAGQAAVAVVMEGENFRVLYAGAVEAKDNNQAERAAFLKALRLAPFGATVITDSGHVQSLLRGRVSPKPDEVTWLKKCLALIRAKGLSWEFSGGRKRRQDPRIRHGHRLADRAAKNHAMLLTDSAKQYSEDMSRGKQTSQPLPPRILAIINRRRELGLTQEELARRAGFSVSLMAKIERGAVDPRSLSTINLTNLARVLGLSLSALLDEDLQALEEHKPLRLPLYSSPEALFQGDAQARRWGFLAPEDVPRGALWEKLAFLDLPSPILVSPFLPFATNRPGRLLLEMRPLISPRGIYVGRYSGQPAIFSQEDMEKGRFPLYPLTPDLPTLWVDGEKPELLGLVRGVWTWL
ncbi:MAG: helix-turn-helix domain-containing protein [Thermus sp.]|nr:helix-turn-helix domain-containing protein [Thermus sp.]